ncbi:MAG: DUF4292 domain-containing protein [Bacteroidetes bacterium]|nr:DUF4292 domain-containing protein [Bacteroidota bacterium]
MKIKSHSLFTILLGTLILSLHSCHTAEEVIDDQQQRRLNEKEAKELLFAKSQIPFYCFYSKVGIDFTDSNRSNSFKATVKMRVDSAFSGTLSVGPVIGASYLVTKDSVFFTDKMKNCYFKENFNYLTAIFGTEIEYQFFQALMLGLPLGLDEEIKYNYKHTRDYYILSSYKKKDLRRIEGEEDAIFVQYYLNTTTHNLDRIAIQVPSDTVAIEIDYQNRIAYDSFMLPEQTHIKIVQPKDSILINLDFGSVKLNECKEIDINIPDSYVKCK